MLPGIQPLHFTTAISPLDPKSDVRVLALRICKADVIVGLPAGVGEELRQTPEGSSEACKWATYWEVGGCVVWGWEGLTAFMLSGYDTETNRFIDNTYITKKLWTIQPALLYLRSRSRNYWPDYNGPPGFWMSLF